MSVRIKSVRQGSPAYFRGIRGGDELVSVNGTAIEDVLDYRFFADEPSVEMVFERGGKTASRRFVTGGDIDRVGLEFDTYLMDRQHSCRNKCIFCFIDQMPPGLRDTLYFKDDDSRLSFLFGNYVTLTNMSEREVDRIIALHISPINVSVHTMNRDLRVRMMKNPRAGESLDIMYRFAQAGIAMNSQLVLCRDVNDGPELEFSLKELSVLRSSVKSVACVPAGLTRYRDGLPHIEPYDKDSASAVIDAVDSFNESLGERFAFAADEFFLTAKREIPPAEYYGSYPQLENGVGLLRSFTDDFLTVFDAESVGARPVSIGIVTGEASEGMMTALCERVRRIRPDSDLRVYTVKNDFFGRSVTVSGLLTARDITSQLGGIDLPEKISIPGACFRSKTDRVTLDDVSVDELSVRLGREIIISDGSGADFARMIMGVNDV